MSLDDPPTYYFNDINYNGSFYGTNPTTGAGGGISTSYANANYLKRTGNNILSTALSTTFTGALNSNSGITTPLIKALNYVNYNARVYPPELVAGATISGTTSTVIIGKLVTTQSYTVEDQGIAYGLGKYILYGSPLFIGYQLSGLIDNNLTAGAPTSVAWAGGNYASGVYKYNTGIDSTYFGDWFIIKYPNPIILRKYEIYQVYITECPAEFKIYGSSDGVNFIEIPEASQLTRLTSADYIGGKYTRTISGLTTPYLYYGMCVNKLTGTNVATDLMHFAEFKLYGDESVMNTTSDILKFNGSMYVTQRSNYSSINQYPPRLYDSVTAESSMTFLGQTGVIFQQLVLNYSIGSYGTGNYNIYSSSGLSTYDKKYLFDYNTDTTSLTLTGAWATNKYTAGNYNGSSNINGYLGDWLVINTPQSILLKYYYIVGRNVSGNLASAPGVWKVYGSTDGLTFEEIPDAHQLTRYTVSDYTNNNNSFIKQVTNQTKYYNWFGFCFNKITGSDEYLLLKEISIYGI